MRAQALWPKHDYAWIPNRGRNQSFSQSCKRIQITRIYKHKGLYAKNASTFVEAHLLNHDGTSEGTLLKSIRAYDIIDFWEDWWMEYGEKVQAHVAFLAKEKAEREREQNEREAVAQKLKDLHPMFRQGTIEVSNYRTTFSISTTILKELLEIEHISVN